MTLGGRNKKWCHRVAANFVNAPWLLEWLFVNLPYLKYEVLVLAKH